VAETKEGRPPEETAPNQNIITTEHHQGGSPNGTSGYQGGERPEVAFVRHLLELGVPLFTAEPGGRRDVVPDLDNEGELIEVVFRGPDDPEFVRPRGWPSLTAEGNDERLSGMRVGTAVCANTGQAIAVVDVDPRNGGDVDKVRALLDELKVRIFAEVETPSGGWHFYVAAHDDLASMSSRQEKGKLPDFPGVDIQSHGRNVFLPGTPRPKYYGAGYTVIFDDLEALATEGDPEGAEALAQWMAEQRAAGSRKSASARDRQEYYELPTAEPWTGGEPDQRQAAYLKKVVDNAAGYVAEAPAGERNERLFVSAMKCGSFIAGAGLDQDKVIAELEMAAIECRLSDDDGTHSVFATMNSGLKVGKTNPRAVPGDPRVPASDKGNAILLAEEYSQNIRYIPEIGKWAHWNGVLWHIDPDSGMVDTAAGQIAMKLPTSTKAEQSHRRQSLSMRGITSMVRLARSDSAMRCRHDQLDANGWQLNTPTGIVDLRTGEVYDHRPDAWHTKITGAGYDPSADCPRWMEFLDTTFEGKQKLITYLQGLCGHAAIGEVLSHILPFLWGAGHNGKTVLLEVLSGVLGDYAIPAPANFLLAGRDKHETEIARLCGARFVVCSEINQGTRFDEAKVKLLTGGDTLTGRFMHGNFFAFRPSHTLFLVGNHQPTVGAGGHAFWRRLRLVEFSHEVPEEDRIEGLADQLVEAEGPAILRWIVDGARRAAAGEVVTPEEVLAATEEYEESEDRIKQFLDDCTTTTTTTSSQDRELVRNVYDRYVSWCHERRIRDVLEDSVFGREIYARGYKKSKSNNKRYVHGLQLLSPTPGSRM
jgi:P4 family phage/plasmid primase-like protien